MKTVLTFMFIFLSAICLLLYPCTVFYATDGSVTLAGNNEDWSDPNTKIWFFLNTELVTHYYNEEN